MAVGKAVIEAQHYLEKSHADLIIWGVVIPVEEKRAPRLFWTTSKNNQRSSDLLNAEGVQLPEPFWQELASMLQRELSATLHEIHSL
jgi:hypothetical protein